MRIAFIGNQGGRDVVAMYAGMARVLAAEFGGSARFAVWLDAETGLPAEFGVADADVSSFESFVRRAPAASMDDVDRLNRTYPDVNWSEVVAAERAFSDYSMLLGGAGERTEDAAYIHQLVVAIVGYLEQVLDGVEAVVCQTPDTLFSLVAIKVARQRGRPVFAVAPAWLLEPGTAGGFFANDEFLHCTAMIQAFAARDGRPLTAVEDARCNALIAAIRGFTGKTEFLARVSTKANTAGQVITPQVGRLVAYLRLNGRRDKHVEYTKIDVASKVLANIRRLVRRGQARRLLGSPDLTTIPARSVFFPLHFQPEQSTLAQAIWYVNQVALVEDVSKSLPLGYTLVVKEHPWSVGVRPPWQYRHLQRLPNVIFCNAPAKAILGHVEAVVTVTGTTGMEALVYDKPTVILGRTFYDFSDLLYRVDRVQDLPAVLRRILLDRDYDRQLHRDQRLRRFLTAYLDGLVPAFPIPEQAAVWARALARELRLAPGSPRPVEAHSA